MADKRTELLDAARSFSGYRYRLDPPPNIADGTIDCSLLILEAAKKAGIPLAGVRTAEQIRQATAPVPWDQVKPGDLLFFEGTYNAAGPAGPDGRIASHVGFSLGAGSRRMIDAHERNGPDVAETDISGDYWQGKLFDARRLPSLTVQEPEQPAPVDGMDPWRRWTPELIAAATKCPVDAVRENWPRLVEQMAHCGITDDTSYLAMIGTIAIESASTFRPVREAFFLGEPEPAESHRRTLRYYPYYGRGFIQNTWESNYAGLGPKIAALWGAGPSDPTFDLVANPDNLLDPDMSAAAAAIYFRDHGGGALARAAREGNWAEVRRLVLGGPDPKGVARIQTIATALSSVPAPATPEPAPIDPPMPPMPPAVTRAEVDALIEHSQAMTNALAAIRDRLPAA